MNFQRKYRIFIKINEFSGKLMNFQENNTFQKQLINFEHIIEKISLSV